MKSWLDRQRAKQEQQSLDQIANEQKLFETCIKEGNFEEAHLHRICRDIEQHRHNEKYLKK